MIANCHPHESLGCMLLSEGILAETIATLLYPPLSMLVWFHSTDCFIVPGCWSSWGVWSNCDLKGDCVNLNGMRSRTRTCTNGNFGKGFCEGNKKETEECAADDPCKLSYVNRIY